MMKRVRINVGGTVFTTLITTLQSIPGSKLANLELQAGDHYDPESKEYYFDRDPIIFNCILNLYRTGSLHLTKDVCGIQFKNELEFWGIPPVMISKCCWKTFYRSNKDIEILNFLLEEFCPPKKNSITYSDEKSISSKIGRIKNCIWVFLMNPSSSTYAKVWYWVYMVIVLVSIATYFVDTFSFCRENEVWLPTSNNDTAVTKVWRIIGEKQKPGIRIINLTCNIIFMLEFILRFFASSNKIKFCKCFINTADFLAVVGFLIVYSTPAGSLQAIYEQCKAVKGHHNCMSRGFTMEDDGIDTVMVHVLLFGHILLSFRNFRFYRLGRMVKMLKLLILALRQSARELGLLFLVILINAIVFAGLIFYAELLNGKHFDDYFEAFYWSVITMTTIGYGDVFPNDVWGRLVAILCSITGLFLLTMPIAVISGNFNELNSRNRDRERHKKDLELFYKSSKNEKIKDSVNYISILDDSNAESRT